MAIKSKTSAKSAPARALPRKKPSTAKKTAAAAALATPKPPALSAFALAGQMTACIPGSLPLGPQGERAEPVPLMTPTILRKRDPLPLPHAVALRSGTAGASASTALAAAAASTAADAFAGEADFQSGLAGLLGGPGAAGNLLPNTQSTTNAIYDFDEFMFLRNQLHPYVEPRKPGSRLVIPKDPLMARFLQEANYWIRQFVDYAVRNATVPYNQAQPYMEACSGTVFAWWASVCSVRAFNRLVRYAGGGLGQQRGSFARWQMTPEQYYAYALYTTLIDNATIRNAAIDYFNSNGSSNSLAPLADQAAWEVVVSRVFERHFAGIERVEDGQPGDDYPFELFPDNEVLFGLQIVHRQSWQFLANVRGELVKTIPLGPKESQKISVKLTRQGKRSSTNEESTSFETSTENSATAKDSDEVVREASTKSNKHAEAEISGGYGPFVQASVSGGLSEDLASSSRQTANTLNESMKKTASRMKRDTKVVVTTESEDGFEMNRSSELTNPNDEVAITYLYHRLQSRYWVSTSIAEVHSVVFVPEHVPSPKEINEQWIRRNGSVLKESLLDKSFEAVLDAIRAEPSNMTTTVSGAFQSAADAAVTATRSITSYKGGGALPDLLSSGQQFLERDLERRTEAAQSLLRRSHQTAGLIEHVRLNILYYMRAIWRSEDYDQRMQRYSRLRVPTAWNFVPYDAPPATGPAPQPLQVEGLFVADDSSARPLTDVINPIGPIGYLFNCAIFRLRDDPHVAAVHQALSYLRAAYMRFDVTVTLSTNSGCSVRQSLVDRPRGMRNELTLQYSAAETRWLLPIPGRGVGDWLRLPRATTDGAVDVYGSRIWLTGTPVDGAQMTVLVQASGELEDPHRRLVMAAHPLPPPNQEAQTFNADVLSSMAMLVPEVAQSLDGATDWSTLTSAQQALLRAHWHDWLLRSDSGRLVNLDTGNVVLDLDVSQTAALEPFKRLHRYIDVVREYESMKRIRLENTRRQALLDNQQYGDPDIDKVAVVSSQAAALVAGLHDETPT